MAEPRPVLAIHASVCEIPAADWDACTDPAHPFTRHAFLSAIESGQVVGETVGVVPRPLTLRDAQGRIEAAVPLYLKPHSRGEDFDESHWAAAYERRGGLYHPKLHAMVPFTSVAGRRFLLREPGNATLRQQLAEQLPRLVQREGLSSAHILYAEPQEIEALRAAGWVIRSGLQLHWRNRSYRDFRDYLAHMKKDRRDDARRDRRKVAREGITHAVFPGGSIRSEHWDTFVEGHRLVQARYGRPPRFTRSFLERLDAVMPESIAMIMARREGRWIAGILIMFGPDRIYLRTWGVIEPHPFLHFETCLYQAIELAIQRGISVIEGGGGGEHKLARGFEPVTIQAAHWIADPQLREAVARYVELDNQSIERTRVGFLAHSPFSADRVLLRRRGAATEPGP